MRAAMYESFGDPAEVLSVGERPLPEPKPGQVRVRMRRAAIHNHDLWMVRGSYGVRPPLPAIGGSEAAGVIDALGEGVTGVEIGQRVAGFAAGAWAEFFVTPAAALLPLPDAVSDDVGCQLVAMPLSAMTLVDHYAVKPEEWLVQNAANGAVGKALATIARSRGVKVVNLVRSAAGVRELAAIGVEGAIATGDVDWKERVRELVGETRVACAIDSVGGKASADLAALLSPGGTLVAFGSMSGEPMEIPSGDLIFRGIRAEGFWLSSYAQTASDRTRRIRDLVELIARGELVLPVAGVYPLADVRAAVTASVAASRGGKVLLSA